MPCVSSNARARILEGFELKPLGGQADIPTIGEQPFPIGGYQMGHWVTLPAMTVQPETAIHCEDHPVASLQELAVRGRDFSGHAPTVMLVRPTTGRRSILRTSPARMREPSRRTRRIRWAMPWGE